MDAGCKARQMQAQSRIDRRGLLAGVGALAAAAVLPGRRVKAEGSVLQVWGGVPAASGPAEVIQGFERENPGSKVSYTRFVNDDWGNLKLDTALQGGVEIDVYFSYPLASLALRTDSGLAADLTGRVAADPQLTPFLDQQQPRAYWSDGRILALATAREPNFVLVNERRRQEARAELPGAWTIDDFRAFARRLTTPGSPGAYAAPDTARIALGPNYWYTADGRSNFADPRFLEWLRLGQDMIREGGAYPWTEVLARRLEVYQQNGFLTGEFAVWPTAPFNLRYLKDLKNYPHDFVVSCAPVPRVPGGGDWNTGTFNNFVMINPNSPRQELAWQFVKYWVTKGGGPMMKGGKIPALDQLDGDAILAGLLGSEPERFFDVSSFRRVLLDEGIKLSGDTNLTAYPEIHLACTQQRNLCWIDEKSPEDAVRAIDARAEAAIERYRGRS